jgi:peptidoglycan L-alanyl-D-glutamate endopeptidase CwlK
MPKFSVASRIRLAQAHPDIQQVMNEAIKTYDFSVICGYRNKVDQEKAYQAGNSKAHFLQSPHNYKPSVAVDIVPYPLDWNDLDAFKKLGAHIMATAKKLHVSLRWGADWNMNGRTDDEKFRDFPHFELHPWRNHAKG